MTLLGRRREALTGRPVNSIVSGPRLPEKEWAELIAEGRSLIAGRP